MRFSRSKLGYIARRKKRRGGSVSGEMELQITSMADIFTILLVFLLKSYSAGTTIAPSAGTILPQAWAAEAPVEALKLEVAEKGISIEGNLVTPLTQYQFENGDLGANGVSSKLGAALDKERQRQLLIAKNNPEVKVDARIVVISDQKVPYSTLKSVLASAAVHGYTDFKLAVLKGD